MYIIWNDENSREMVNGNVSTEDKHVINSNPLSDAE